MIHDRLLHHATRTGFLVLVVVGVALSAAWGSGVPRTPSPDGARLYFISPRAGEEVERRFTVRFGLSGMGVAPAGVTYPNSGHHHLLIDAAEPDPGQAVPADENHRHFGRGQTEAQIELPPGTHTLQLVLGDANHIPHDPPVVSERITITVR